MKTALRCIRDFETIIPAGNMIANSPRTGEVTVIFQVPETRIKTAAGTIVHPRNKDELKRLMESGNWELA